MTVIMYGIRISYDVKKKRLEYRNVRPVKAFLVTRVLQYIPWLVNRVPVT